MKRITLSAGVSSCLILLLSCFTLLFTTCKRQNDHLARVEKGDDEFIVWHLNRDTNAIIKLWKATTATVPQSTQDCHFSYGYVTTYGVTRTGSCATGYSYTLRLDDVVLLSGLGKPLLPYATINGVKFSLNYAWVSGPYYHYWLSASYTSFGVADANYCNTDSLTIAYGSCTRNFGTSETIKLTPSEACGSTNPDVTITTAHYSYPPTTMTLPRTGGADLGLLVNLCTTCTVRYPDNYVFQYRPTGTTTWTTVTVPYPQYLFYSVSLPSGTYDLQGNNNCAPGSPVPNDGPVVSGSPATFTVL